jgi:hypothetical protein
MWERVSTRQQVGCTYRLTRDSHVHVHACMRMFARIRDGCASARRAPPCLWPVDLWKARTSSQRVCRRTKRPKVAWEEIEGQVVYRLLSRPVAHSP